MSEKYDTQIFRVDGKNCFLEVLNSSFSFKINDTEIRKVLIRMVNYDENTYKQKLKLDFYLSFQDAMVLSYFITSGLLDKKIALAKQEGKFEGAPINDFTSYWTNLGGIKEARNKDVEEFSWAELGKPISRQLKIQVSSKYKYMLRGEYNTGTIGETGLIIPAKGSAKDYIQLPLSENDAFGLALALSTHLQAFWNQYYNRFSNVLFPNLSCNVFKADANYSNNAQAASSSVNKNTEAHPIPSVTVEQSTVENTDEDEQIPFYDSNMSEEKLKRVILKATTNLLAMPKNPDDKCIKCTESGNEIALIFKKDVIDTTEKYSNFNTALQEKIAQKKELEFKAYVSELNGRYYFKKFA